jgi:peptidoglycan-N-acetylglucosamine deacetylase
MGAPFFNWLFRGATASALLAGVAVIISLPLGTAARAALLVTGGGVAILLAFRLLPAFDPLGRVRWRLPRAADGIPRCALTFDDGPGPATGAVLDILSAEGVKATFFVLGENVRRHPGVVKRLHAEGHAIGLHGWSHQKMIGPGVEDAYDQLARLTGLLEELGVTASPLFRSPHGVKSRATFRAARRRGLTVWAWSRGVWDTARPAPGVLVRRATRFVRPGMVLLLHDGRGEEPTPDVSSMTLALPTIIAALKRRGFRFVRLIDAG